MHRSTLVLCLAAFACDPATTTDVDTPDDSDTDVEATYPDGIAFDVVVGDAPAQCGVQYDDFAASASTTELRDLRFYLHDLKLSGPDGEANVTLTADGEWSDGRTVLLDFEDGTGRCADAGDARMNKEALGNIPEGNWDTLTFTVGVPFETNHLDIAVSDAPLDVAPMFWNWQGGRKFVRIDLHSLAAPQPIDWNLHIGSGGCDSSSAIESPEVTCDRPNLATISIPFDPFSGEKVVLDLEAVFAGVSVVANTEGSPSGCMANPLDTAECAPVFAAFGMLYSTGECDNDCDNQAAFSTTP